MRMASLFIVLLMLLSFGGRANATAFQLWPPSLNAPGTVLINRWGISDVTVERRTSDTGYWGESYLLKVNSQAGTATFPFDTTYGNFRFWIDNLIGETSPQIILVTSRGRGTSSSAYFLDVYRLQNSHFVKTYEMQISEYFGPGDIWKYEVDFQRRPADTDFIKLSLVVDEPDHDQYVVPTLIPKHKKLYIVWDKTSQKFIATTTKPDIIR